MISLGQQRVLAAAPMAFGAKRVIQASAALQALEVRFGLTSTAGVKQAIDELLARRDHIAWGACRAALIAGKAHDAYLLDVWPAWKRAKAAVRLAQGACRSWKDLEAVVIESANALGDRELASYSAPSSNVPWETAIDDAKAIRRRAHTWIVGGGDGAKTIAEALRQAQPGHCIVVGAGVYPESLVVRKPVEIIGEGTVVLDGGDAPCVQVKGGTVVLSGLTLRSRRIGAEVDGKSSLAVIRATRVAATRGLNALGGARLVVQRCQVLDCDEGLFAADRDTRVVIVRSLFSGRKKRATAFRSRRGAS